MEDSERIAKAFHENYERLASAFSYVTREASAKPWDEVPENNKKLMMSVVDSLIGQRIIEVGEGL